MATPEQLIREEQMLRKQELVLRWVGNTAVCAAGVVGIILAGEVIRQDPFVPFEFGQGVLIITGYVSGASALSASASAGRQADVRHAELLAQQRAR